MAAPRLVVCAVALLVALTASACGRKPPTPGPLAVADGALIVKDIIDVFDQPTYTGVPKLCEVLTSDPVTSGIVGSLPPSKRNISDRTERSPFTIPLLIGDALDGARHAECHWTPLVTPQNVRVSVEVTAYNNTPATRYARAAFSKVIDDRHVEYERVGLGSAACVGWSERTYVGLLRKDNVLMAVTVSVLAPTTTEQLVTAESGPAYELLAVLDEQFGGRGQGAPEQSPDSHDDCW